MHPERRTLRSDRPDEALHHFLTAARDRLGVRTLTVGTTDGSLIAGAGADARRVAKLGARADAASGQPNRDVATWRTRVGERELVLTSWGRAMSADLAAGVRRILGG
jgi:hypothetical protein